MIRRSIDILVALALLPVALMLGAITAIIVARHLGRPLLFRQMRAGRDGKPFELMKFRTMWPPLAVDRPHHDDAARTPPATRRLRRLRLDELPQLWNVLAGDMAIIGPRPLLPETVAAMAGPGVARGAIRPGLTGWAQVHGNSLLSDADKLALDCWYIENQSVWLDLEILLRTVGVIVFGERRNPLAVERGHAGTRRRRG